jgi:2-amino-4-hydroxy-6-hydroxymethyldihydropteridine diphosphokinase
VFCSLGTNLGNKKENLSNAIKEIKKIAEIIACSSVYETEPCDIIEQLLFLNQVIKIETGFGPLELLKELQDIEKSMGRIRTIKNGPRIIDIDILFYGDKIINTEVLTIPHSGTATRQSVLMPLYEIAPEFVHPTEKKTVKYLLSRQRYL